MWHEIRLRCIKDRSRFQPRWCSGVEWSGNPVEGTCISRGNVELLRLAAAVGTIAVGASEKNHGQPEIVAGRLHFVADTATRWYAGRLAEWELYMVLRDVCVHGLRKSSV